MLIFHNWKSSNINFLVRKENCSVFSRRRLSYRISKHVTFKEYLKLTYIKISIEKVRLYVLDFIFWGTHFRETGILQIWITSIFLRCFYLFRYSSILTDPVVQRTAFYMFRVNSLNTGHIFWKLELSRNSILFLMSPNIPPSCQECRQVCQQRDQHYSRFDIL